MNIETTMRNKPFKLLSTLGPVVETRDLELAAGSSKKIATENASKWTKEGMLKPFASGVWFNLVRDPKSPETHLFEAAMRANRRPVILIGASALRAAGWTTQMPNQLEAAIVVNRQIRTWKKMNGISTDGRSVKWFSTAMTATIKTPNSFDLLKPEYALVDAIMARSAFEALPQDQQQQRYEAQSVTWYPDPDDISLPVDCDAREITAQILHAAKRLGANLEDIHSYLSGVDDLHFMVGGSPSHFPTTPQR